MSEYRFMSGELLSRVVYPTAVVCMHCEANIGHEEVVRASDDLKDYGGQKAG